ncbi:MAG: nucleoside recognition domain-containing protein [Bacillota bacterium]|nr:nucleoside recognition domain-containing protein [Bacillota bacterium]
MGLCGLICLWMGLLRVAEAAGLVQSLGRMLSPLLRRLFPSVPKGHPAMGALVMNVSANLLGLGNAATPMGLKAMALLQELNPDKEHASDAMQTLLALNTAAITLMPSMVIALRTAAASEDPAGILGATLLSSSMGMAFALLLDAVLRRRRR